MSQPSELHEMTSFKEVNMSQPLPELLTPKELADYLGVSEASLAQARYKSRGVPYIRVGKRVRYLRADLLNYLKRSRAETAVRAKLRAGRKGKSV